MFSDNKRTLRLVQYNVENLFLTLDKYAGQNLTQISEAEWRRLSTSTTPNKSLRKTQELATILESLKADILMLNEVGGLESLENFNQHFLGNKYSVHLKEGNSQRGIDVGYLIRKDLEYKSVLLSHKNRPLNFLYPHETQTPSGGKSHYFSRDVSELRLFKPDSTTPSLVVLLTHLKSKLDSDRVDPEGKLRRAAELKTLVDIYLSVKKELGEETPILVAGDLNGIAAKLNMEPEFAPLHENTDLKDVLELAQKPTEERYTQVQITYSGKQEFVQIDYILASAALYERVLPSETFVYRYKDPAGRNAPAPRNLEERSLYASDHYPVVLTLKWP